jgi:hypothetical protein
MMMGLGPWAQGELIRDVQRAERQRFHRLIFAARMEMHRRVPRGKARTDFGEVLDNLKTKITPKRKRDNS